MKCTWCSSVRRTSKPGELCTTELGVRVGTREMAWSCIMSGEGYARWRVLGKGVAEMLAEREKGGRREEK